MSNMIELKEKASVYAEENVINVLKEAFAKVYADGYRDGYKDCEEEIPANLSTSQTEFVDLGLPSGTLWAADFEGINGKMLYLTHQEAMKYNLPTEQQCKELLTLCKWSFKNLNSAAYRFDCLGPNGNMVSFFSTGMITSKDASIGYANHLYFWLYDVSGNVEKNCVHAYAIYAAGNSWKIKKFIDASFVGYKLPIRLVSNK